MDREHGLVPQTSHYGYVCVSADGSCVCDSGASFIVLHSLSKSHNLKIENKKSII